MFACSEGGDRGTEVGDAREKAGRAEDSRKESPAGHSRVCSEGAREGEHRAGA